MKKNAPGLALPTRSCGRRAAPAVLFLHGFLGSSADWLPVADRLKKEWRCLLPDLPGHGRAHFRQHPEFYSFDGAAQAVFAGVTAPMHLVGYSLGGRLALQLAAQHPEKILSLSLISSSPGLATAQERTARRRADDALATELETRGLNAFLSSWYAQALFGDLRRKSALFRRLLARRRRNDAAELALVLRGCSVGRQRSLWPQLPKLEMPVLLLAGRGDEKYVRLMRRMQAQISGAQCCVVPGAAHAVVEEQPARVARLLEKFWRDNSGRGQT